jgi:hypothetical protein
MKLVFRGGLWDGVELESRFVPQEIRLSGVIIDDAEKEAEVKSSLRKTVLMSRVGKHRYELDEFEGPNEEIAIFVYQDSMM